MPDETESSEESKQLRKNITITLTEDLAAAMEQYPEVKWSEVGRQAFWDYLNVRRMDLFTLIEELYYKQLKPISHTVIASKSGLRINDFKLAIEDLVKSKKILKFRYATRFYYCTAVKKPECDGCENRQDCGVDNRSIKNEE